MQPLKSGFCERHVVQKKPFTLQEMMTKLSHNLFLELTGQVGYTSGHVIYFRTTTSSIVVYCF